MLHFLSKPSRKPGAVELRVTLQNEINAQLYYSLPLCIILANEKLTPWYYENFIEIFSHDFPYQDKEYLHLRYLCDMNCNRYNTNFYGELADEICLGYDLLKQERNIGPFLIDNIGKGYYAIIYLDEYYLPGKENYQKEHLVHESLIYGYDDAQKKFMAIGFDANHSFGMMRFDYPRVREAFEKGKLHYKDEGGIWAETMAVRLIKPVDFEKEYPFSLERYLAKLSKYRFPAVEPARIYPFRLANEATCQFGINVHDAVVAHLKKLLKGKMTLEFKELHFLYEHKKHILGSLKFIQNRFQPGGGLQSSIDKYQDVIKMIDDVRLMLLKYTFQRKKSLKNVEEMIQKIETVRDNEKDILLKIIDYLKTRG